MEFWLSFNNREEILQLPVPPPEFQITQGNILNTVNINDIGEYAIIGKRRLATITLSSFFPNQNYSFCQYNGFPKPYDCVNLIEKWRKTSRPIRLVITGTNINIAVCIEEFSWSEKDSTGDVYFNLNLKEYRFLDITTTTIQSGNTTTSVQIKQRPTENKTTSNSYTVRSGDTLYDIAKLKYGDGSKYSLIAQKNNIKDPNKISIGQTLLL